MARQIEATHAWLEQLVYRTTLMEVEEAMIKLVRLFFLFGKSENVFREALSL